MDKNINQEWLTRPTGDPFVDVGGYVIEYLQKEVYPKDSILQLIDRVTKIYVNTWNAKLNAFFLNSKVTQPAFKGARKIEETAKYFSALINESEPYETGFCRITGQEGKLFDAGRDNSIMSGSRTFINFHHAFERGLKLSKEVLIRLHFVPLGSVLLSGKVALIKSNKHSLTRLFVHQNIKNNLQNIASGANEGIYRSEFNNPANALFDFAKKAIIEAKEELVKGASLTLYHYTNFGASPEIDIYQMPSKIFLYYYHCNQISYKEDWKKFVRYHYKKSKHGPEKYIASKDVMINEKKNVTIEFDEFKTWNNIVYYKLLNNDSILPQFREWSKEHSINFDIIRLYQQIINNMKTETVNKILEIADFIIHERSEDGIKRIITRLDKSANGSQIRRVLLGLVKENHNRGNEPLISVEDYTEYLFPDTYNSREIRDLLLIAIYQKIHESSLKLELELETEEENE